MSRRRGIDRLHKHPAFAGRNRQREATRKANGISSRISRFAPIVLTTSEADELDHILASGEARPRIAPVKLEARNDASQAVKPGSEVSACSHPSATSGYVGRGQSPLRAVIIAAVLALASAICGCAPEPTKDSSIVIQHGALWVRVIEVEGEKYIVASTPHGCAICPKVKPTAEVGP